jgi:hypothetical protein
MKSNYKPHRRLHIRRLKTEIRFASKAAFGFKYFNKQFMPSVANISWNRYV